jgi:hypothetical protein
VVGEVTAEQSVAISGLGVQATVANHRLKAAWQRMSQGMAV